MEEGGSRRKWRQETRQWRRKVSRAGSSLLENPCRAPRGPRQPYRGIDGEGPLPVACSDVKGEECIAPAVGITGQDVGNEAGDGAILADGDVHGEVQQHGVIVVDVQHPNPHQHLGHVRGEGGGRRGEGGGKGKGGVGRQREKEGHVVVDMVAGAGG